MNRTVSGDRLAVRHCYGRDARVQLHLWLRWLTCPYPAISAEIPAAGRILDVGCGHGHFALHLAAASPDRSVEGIDVDEGKLRHADAAATQASRHGVHVSFSLATPGRIPTGPWDCITIIDVLYLMPPATQQALLQDCAAALSPGGLLLVKEMAHYPAWKLRWNTAQERLAVNWLHLTRGELTRPLPPDQLSAWMTDDGLTVTARPIHHGYLHPHHLLVGRA